MKQKITMAMLLSAMCAAAIEAPWARYTAESSPISNGDGHNSAATFVLADVSGNGHDASIIGWAFSDSEPVRGKVICSTGWYSSCLYGNNPAGVSRTYSAWVKRDIKSAVGSGYADLTGDDPLCLLVNFAGLDIRTAYTGNTWQVYADGTKVAGLSAVYARARWQHLALTVADSGARNGLGRALCTVKLYADGVLAAFASNVLVDAEPSGTIDFMGRHDINNNHHSFPAWLDDIRIYDKALSTEDIESIYDSTRAVMLAARFPMDATYSSGGECFTTNIVDGACPMRIGSQVQATNGLEGVGALFFPGPSSAVASAFPSYGVYTNETVDLAEDMMLSFWVNRSSAQCATGAMRFFNLGWLSKSAGAYAVPLFTYQNSTNSATLTRIASSLPGIMSRNEEWQHFAIVFSYGFQEGSFDDDGTLHGNRFSLPSSVRMRTYLNGVKTSDNYDSQDPKLRCFMSRKDAYCTLANDEANWKSPARMTVDDVRFYYGPIDDDFVKTVSLGTARVDAGEDFTVAGENAVLHGQVGEISSQKISAGYSGQSTWTLVSAPTGGEGASIEAPGAAVTRVTLPVEGAYVFRLSNAFCGADETDDVTVTRNDSAQGAGCTASVVVRANSGLCAVVEATGVAAGARVRWMSESGPGGVFFKDYSATNTLVTFSAAGSYTLCCEVSDGASAGRYSLSVSATGTTLVDQMTNSLTAHWDCEISDKARNDKVAGYKLNPQFMTYETGANFVPGVGGGYGARVGYGASLMAENRNYCYMENEFFYHRGLYDTMPLDEWITVSLWMYHDGEDPMPCYSAVLAMVYGSQGITYLPRHGGSTDFEAFAINGSAQWQRAFFKGPERNLTNRWTHVVAMINQRNTRPQELVEIWVDGCKLEQRPHPDGVTFLAMTSSPRRQDQRWDFGGCRNSFNMSYDFEGGPATQGYSMRFPGFLDEIRVYHRRLNEAEIRYLHDCPNGPVGDLAPSVTVSLDAVRITCREDATVAASAYSASAGSSLSYKWSVISGDASKVNISDDTSITPTVRFTRSGEYRLQLAVNDGLRTSYSEPLLFTVSPNGMVLIFK